MDRECTLFANQCKKDWLRNRTRSLIRKREREKGGHKVENDT